ncbi:hypothetical protein L0152_25530 [bacterium]|nr:hypothetical protein [bacterium]
MKTNATEREQALALFADNKWIEALPTLKMLYNANPDDLAVLEALAWSSFAQAATVRDKEIRKKAMKGARDLAVKAKEMGTTSAPKPCLSN